MRYEEQRGLRRPKCCGKLGVTRTAATLKIHQMMMTRGGGGGGVGGVSPCITVKHCLKVTGQLQSLDALSWGQFPVHIEPQFHGRPACIMVTILTELSWLLW
jgi:hypothetical protein